MVALDKEVYSADEFVPFNVMGTLITYHFGQSISFCFCVTSYDHCVSQCPVNR